MSRKKKPKARKSKSRSVRRPKRQPIELGVLEAIIERAKSSPLSEDDHEKLKAAIETLAFITRELESKRVSIIRLKKLLFGASTEKTSRLFGDSAESDAAEPASDGAEHQADGAGPSEPSTGAQKPKRKGHGRNGAVAYRGAKNVKVPHTSLERGQRCTACGKGKLYPLEEPAVLVRVTGMAPLGATVYECERLRCNGCGQVLTAQAPEGVGAAKYDESAPAMIGLLKYGCGLPWNRLERLQKGLGIPLPATTQWELVRDAEPALAPVYEELTRQAAQGEVLHNDDTTAKILELMVAAGPIEPGPDPPACEPSDDKSARTGVFTTGIVSVVAEHRIALFFTGRKHAGENLAEVLAHRAAALGPPIQMSDALPTNTAGDFETIMANCNAHARRRFVDVVDAFPDECRYVIETLREVYRHDAQARALALTAEQRLAYHQERSGPMLADLEQWLARQFDEKLVEPNSGLGEAIGYMRKHWSKLTLFLRVPGTPLDNNIAERALKKAILHRKNALFYKTLNGARVGDTFMSLIHTTELSDGDPFDYLVALLRNQKAVAKDPAAWMPWNYRDALSDNRVRVEGDETNTPSS